LLLTSCGGSGTTDTDSEPDTVLTPSDTPATDAPDSNDEPVAEDTAFNNALGFDVVREPGPRLAVIDVDIGISDEEFAEGLPRSIVQVPADVDPDAAS